MTHYRTTPIHRRAALGGLGGLALSSLLMRDARVARSEPEVRPAGPDFTPRAKRAIWLFMAGAPSQLETFDYKPGLADRYDQDLPD
ncbi:MAG TPA: DUF1501 domain-containing protein, partial [Polyangiaceae bacterium]